MHANMCAYMNACTLKHTRTQVYIHARKHANKHIYATRVDMRAGSRADIFARVYTCRYVRAILHIHVHLHMGDPKTLNPTMMTSPFFLPPPSAGLPTAEPPPFYFRRLPPASFNCVELQWARKGPKLGFDQGARGLFCGPSAELQ